VPLTRIRDIAHRNDIPSVRPAPIVAVTVATVSFVPYVAACAVHANGASGHMLLRQPGCCCGLCRLQDQKQQIMVISNQSAEAYCPRGYVLPLLLLPVACAGPEAGVHEQC
jgi:hypothetical protein